MSIPIYQVDAFTGEMFGGNPAAVCLLGEARGESWMQDVASEMNLSETSFLVRRDDGYDLRWFTPATEVDLCGHATLASAHVLWELGHLAGDEEARFHTRSGVLTARRSGEWIELDFPTLAPEPHQAPSELLESLGLEPVAVSHRNLNYVVEVESEKAVRAVQPDFEKLRRLGSGVIVTSRSDDSKFDFVSRYFASAFGIDEDPATGSSHCYLGPYWQKLLGKSEFLAFQASRRGGVIKVRVVGDRTYLGGQAITVLRGELTEPALAAV